MRTFCVRLLVFKSEEVDHKKNRYRNDSDHGIEKSSAGMSEQKIAYIISADQCNNAYRCGIAYQDQRIHGKSNCRMITIGKHFVIAAHGGKAQPDLGIGQRTA